MDDSSRQARLLGRDLSRRQLIAWDAGFAALYILVMWNYAALTTENLSVAAYGWLFVTGAATALRRLWPGPVFGFVLVMTLVALWAKVPQDPFVAAAFALYPVATNAAVPSWFPDRVIAAASMVGALLLTVSGPVEMWYPLPHMLIGMAVLGSSWTFGRVVRDRRLAAAESARRLAQRMVAEERLHIARELHDVVAHSMSLIAVKAAVANHVAEKRPQEAFSALRVIEATSKTAMTEMRQLLGVLRSSHDEPRLAPAPGLEGLPVLVQQAAEAEVRVELRVDDVADLPGGVDLSAYRIVREAVTNVMKHAAPARCEVVVSRDDDRLTITVTDDGPGTSEAPHHAPGHGIRGMAERVAVYDGRFSAEPGPRGGFVVTAVIPLEETVIGAHR